MNYDNDEDDDNVLVILGECWLWGRHYDKVTVKVIQWADHVINVPSGYLSTLRPMQVYTFLLQLLCTPTIAIYCWKQKAEIHIFY